ncbi:hypothetical protein [Oerskovia enterophila]|uniref:DUF4190 domain-containing protein n=1 Tax=Oerskovia enterophila TaxID=43678 RepID=A0ABX2Y8J2_9CELL|nr:hypothetical protein [Oerskovia enterophila]OCI32922.1 hypothetical protein OERS_05140 [Oerskovia enterophila]
MVVTFIGLALVALGTVLVVRIMTRFRGRRPDEQSTGAHGVGIALGGSLVFWGALLVLIDVWNG